ncbi:hypothetical protein QYE76_051936 [Lolium multiflorum]|uniref:Transposase (putative) gypsy type domain-containing protein n=1 Tax=Lolium multiflorum TaxID=4521 RepID=A0AAD8SSR9_LOLMU|nr:hypothetical protein QYE76_051936 [Lolium multiflorum]
MSSSTASFIYGIQLHQLTSNSLLHISIFVTLYECFGIHPHWGLWKRIFYLRCNNSKNTIYNVGGVCIYIWPEVGYFDVKFADSVQGWRKKWLCVKDEYSATQDYGLAPFDSSEDIQRRKSWDAEATAEEKATTGAMIAHIQELQNTEGAELSGMQITAHFLRIRVQPLQARKNPRWMYSGAEDAERVSDDLPLKDLEKLVRHFTSLSKNNEVPSSCRAEPSSGDHALPDLGLRGKQIGPEEKNGRPSCAPCVAGRDSGPHMSVAFKTRSGKFLCGLTSSARSALAALDVEYDGESKEGRGAAEVVGSFSSIATAAAVSGRIPAAP